MWPLVWLLLFGVAVTIEIVVASRHFSLSAQVQYYVNKPMLIKHTHTHDIDTNAATIKPITNFQSKTVYQKEWKERERESQKRKIYTFNIRFEFLCFVFFSFGYRRSNGAYLVTALILNIYIYTLRIVTDTALDSRVPFD